MNTWKSWMLGLLVLEPLAALPELVAPQSASPPPAVAQATSVESSFVSGWFRELVKLAQAGSNEEILLSFIDGAGSFNVGADELIYLRDIGASDSVLKAVIEHDAALASGLQLAPSGVPASPPLIAPATSSTQLQSEVPSPQIAQLRDFLKTLNGSSPSEPTAAEKAAASRPLAVRECCHRTSIVMDSGSPDVWQQWAEIAAQDESTVSSRVAVEAEQVKSKYPVRNPSAEPIVSPIVIISASGRPPNLHVLWGLRD
jgi:hypothetical protein